MNRLNLNSSREYVAASRLDARPARATLSIYYLHPLLAGPLTGWKEHLSRARAFGFSHVCVGPVFAPAPSGDIFLTDDFERTNPAISEEHDADATIRHLAQLCRDTGLHLVLDLVLDRVAADGAMARSAPNWFYRDGSSDVVDPREKQLGPEALPARFAEREHELTAWWTDRVVRLAEAGADGFRLLGLEHVPPRFLKSLIGVVRQETKACLFLGWTPGVPWPLLPAFEEVGLDAVFASTAWWDGRAPWYVEEQNLLRRIGRVIGVAEAPFEERLAAKFAPADTRALEAACRRALRIAATTSQGLFVPMGFEFGARRRMDARRASGEDFAKERESARLDLAEDLVAVNGLVAALHALNTAGEMRSLSGPGAPVSMLLQADAADVRASDEGILVLINNDDKPQPLPTTDTLPPAAGAAFGEIRLLDDDPEPLLAAGEVRVMAVARSQPVADRTRRTGRLAEALKAPRVAIEHVTPCIDGGAFAIKRVIGQSITVEADVFTDGHDVVAAELLWKAVDEKDWTRVRCEALGNDRWKAAFSPRRIGRHLFTIEGWRDDYASLCHEIEVKHKAGVGIALELTEARHYLEQVLSKPAAESAAALRTAIKALEADDVEAAVHALTAPETVAAVAASAERIFVVQHAPISVEVERPQAEFASWYELFPRSQSGDPNTARHLRRRDRPPARHPPDGLRRPVFPADPSDRHEASQGPQQRAERRRPAITAAPTRSAARRAGTTRSIRSSARSTTSAASSPPRARTASRSRSTLRSSARRTIRGCATIPTGSAGVRTAPSNTPRTRRRSTRTSSMSISTAAIRPGSGSRCATSCCSGPARACASSASTIRTPSRCRSGNG